MYHSFLIHSFTGGHLGCFQHLAIVNCAAMNIGGVGYFELVFQDSCGIIPAVKLLGQKAVPCLVFWGNAILFSTMAAPICIPTNSVLGFPFLHSLVSTYYLLICLWWPFWPVWSGISLWYLIDISLVLSFGAHFFFCPFWLPLCVCFHISGWSSMTPCPGRVVLWSRCPVELSDAISFITWAGCFRNILCVSYKNPPVVIESWLLLAHLCVGSTLRLANWGSTLTTVYKLLYRYWPHGAEFALAGSSACWDLSFGYVTYEGN